MHGSFPLSSGPVVGSLPHVIRRSAYFRIIFSRASLDEVVRAYQDWALGIGAFAEQRDRRLHAGIDYNWDRGLVSRNSDLRGLHGLWLHTRAQSKFFLMSLQQADEEVPRKVWENVVSIAESDQGICLSHAVAFTMPVERLAGLPAQEVLGIANSPKVIRTLLEKEQLNSRSAIDGFGGLPRVLGQGDAKSFVDKVLLSPRRKRPILLLAPQIPGGDADFLIEPRKLASRLAVAADVVFLQDEVVTGIVSAALRSRGLLGLDCYHGSARMYPPYRGQRNYSENCRAVGPQLIREYPEDIRTDFVAGKVHDWIGRQNMPRNTWALIRSFDQLASIKSAKNREIELRQIRDQSKLEIRNASRSVEQMAAEIVRLNGEAYDVGLKLMESEDKVKEQEERNAKQEAGWNNSRQDLEDTIGAKQRAITELQSVIKTMKAGGVDPVSKDDTFRSALSAIMTNSLTSLDLLICLERAFPDRVEVLEEAKRSASKHRLGREISRSAVELAALLVTDYWTDLIEGKGDGEARKCFGKAFASTESTTTKANKANVAQRRFVSEDGIEYAAWRHLKLGVGSGENLFRLYFDWDAKKGKVIICSCGDTHFGTSKQPAA